MGIFDLYDAEELARSFGSITVDRGREYHDRGHVLNLDVNDANPRITLVRGTVLGSGGRQYATTVTLAEDPSGTWMDAHCTCPVVRMCKHAAAVMLAAGEQHSGETSTRDWERRLTLVLDELEENAQALASAKNPLGLQVELTPGRRQWRTDQPTGRGNLRLRPVRRGARDNWVRQGASWNDVPYLDRRTDADPAQANVLVELLSAHRAANRQAYFGADAHLSLSTFGPGLWPLLRQAEAVGLTLVPAGELRRITVLPEPVALRIDVNGADTQQAHLGIGVDLEGEWFSGDSLEVLGDTGHGVALWSGLDDGRGPLWDVLLAQLARPAGVQTRRLIAAGHSLPVPRTDLDDLVGDFLPRLQRHLPVVSTDESVRLPEPAEPRLAATVTWKAVDEVHLAWSWRYRMGADDRIYAIDESRGLRGIRRPDA